MTLPVMILSSGNVSFPVVKSEEASERGGNDVAPGNQAR